MDLWTYGEFGLQSHLLLGKCSLYLVATHVLPCLICGQGPGHRHGNGIFLS